MPPGSCEKYQPLTFIESTCHSRLQMFHPFVVQCIGLVLPVQIKNSGDTNILLNYAIHRGSPFPRRAIVQKPRPYARQVWAAFVLFVWPLSRWKSENLLSCSQ